MIPPPAMGGCGWDPPQHFSTVGTSPIVVDREHLEGTLESTLLEQMGACRACSRDCDCCVRPVVVVSSFSSGYAHGISSEPQDQPRAHDAGHVCDIQRPRHVRGDPGCPVSVRFGTDDGPRDGSW